MDAGVPIASVITNPIAGRTLYAHKGEGAWHLESGMQLSVSNNDTLERSVCDISSSSVWFSHIRRRLRGDYKANIPSFSAVAEVASMIALGHLTASIGLWKSPHGYYQMDLLTRHYKIYMNMPERIMTKII